MRPHVREFVRAAAQAFHLRGPIFEFGSFQVAGQESIANLRSLFPGQSYVGCDMRPGPGVDRLEDLGRLSLEDRCAQTVICVDTLEHVFELQAAVDELVRVLAPGGMLLISVPFSFRIHDFPDDYWRLTPACLERLLGQVEATVVGSQGPETTPHTVMAVAAKAPVAADFALGLERFIALYDEALQAIDGQIGVAARWAALGARFLATKGERRRIAERNTTRFAARLSLPGKPHFGAGAAPPRRAARGEA